MEIQPLRKRPHILSLHDRLVTITEKPHGVEDQVSLRWGRDLLGEGRIRLIRARP